MIEFTLAAAIFFSALMAGFFFSFAVSVNLGLHKLNDKAYLQAMQHINRAVLNPLFFSCFFGANLFLIISTVQHYFIDSPKFLTLLCACIIYTVGVFGITGLRNVPLNNRLEQFQLSDSTETSLQQMRIFFEKSWVLWNTVRTLSALAVLACLIASILYF